MRSLVCSKRPMRRGTLSLTLVHLLLTADSVVAECLAWCSEWTCTQPDMCGSCEPCMPRPPPPPLLPNAIPFNPFGTTGGWYVNPTLAANIALTVASGIATVAEIPMLEQMKTIPSAFWIDNYGKIRGSNRLDTLEGILQDAASKSDPPLCVFIFYDLPNRDCNAKASNGEISFGEQDVAEASEAALAIYRTRYVDPFVAVLGEYPRVPVVIVIEPDSLGNVISNAGQHSCSAATVATYKLGVRYAVDALSGARGHLAAGGTVGASMGAPIALYVDAAHGGWMGFEPNAQAFVSLMIEIGILDKIRGFTTNVANYQPLGEGALCPAEAYERAGEMLHGAVLGVADWCKKHVEHACCTEDPCEVLGLGSGGSTELSYVQSLQQHFVMRTGWQPHFVIDTGRNGRPHARSSCRSWCNINGAGAGHVPTMNTGLPSVVDAFYWLKTPGESDGCTRLLPSGQSCARFDSDCEGRDSITTPAAPEAGRWFHYQATMLARNADLRLDAAGALESTFGMTFRPPPPPSFASPLPPLPPPPSSASPPPPSSHSPRQCPPPPRPSPPSASTWSTQGSSSDGSSERADVDATAWEVQSDESLLLPSAAAATNTPDAYAAPGARSRGGDSSGGSSGGSSDSGGSSGSSGSGDLTIPRVVLLFGGCAALAYAVLSAVMSHLRQHRRVRADLEQQRQACARDGAWPSRVARSEGRAGADGGVKLEVAPPGGRKKGEKKHMAKSKKTPCKKRAGGAANGRGDGESMHNETVLSLLGKDDEEQEDAEGEAVEWV